MENYRGAQHNEAKRFTCKLTLEQNQSVNLASLKLNAIYTTLNLLVIFGIQLLLNDEFNWGLIVLLYYIQSVLMSQDVK